MSESILKNYSRIFLLTEQLYFIDESTQLLSTSTHLLFFFRSHLEYVNVALQYVDAAFQYVDAAIQYIDSVWLLLNEVSTLVIDVLTLLFNYVNTFIICVDVFTFLHQPDKFQSWNLCRYTFQVSRPPREYFNWLCRHTLLVCRSVFNKFLSCVDTCCICVDLSLMFLLIVSAHQAYVSTWLWIFFWLCWHSLHACRPVYEMFNFLILNIWPVKYSSSIKI